MNFLTEMDFSVPQHHGSDLPWSQGIGLEQESCIPEYPALLPKRKSLTHEGKYDKDTSRSFFL